MNANSVAAISRGQNGNGSSHSGLMTKASANDSAISRNTHGNGGVRNLRVVSTAASTTMSTPPNTSAFTNQVVPNSSANVATFFVSSSRNAAPMKNRSAYGRMVRN